VVALTWTQRAGCAALAVGGSLVYGASLGGAIRGWSPAGAARWLTYSAGAGWCVLGPALIAGTRLPVMTLADACLVAMARGEAVLLAAAAVNALVWGRSGNVSSGLAAPFNAGAVGVSNVLMGRYIVTQLAGAGASPRRVLALWLLALNGTGGAVAWWLRRLPQEGGAGR
jgi:hypothetical protein